MHKFFSNDQKLNNKETFSILFLQRIAPLNRLVKNYLNYFDIKFCLNLFLVFVKST